jgi:hypothetical protein
MARLYYETPKLNPEVVDGDRSDDKALDYLEKVAKLIPGEVIAGYLAIFGFIPAIKIASFQPYSYWAYLSIFVLCAVLTYFYMRKQALPDKPKQIHLIISTLAFVVWAYVTTGKTLIPQGYDSALASIVLILFSLISGLIPLTR